MVFSPKNNRQNKFFASFHEKETIDKSNSLFYSKSNINVNIPNNNDHKEQKESLSPSINPYEGVITMNNVVGVNPGDSIIGNINTNPLNIYMNPLNLNNLNIHNTSAYSISPTKNEIAMGGKSLTNNSKSTPFLLSRNHREAEYDKIQELSKIDYGTDIQCNQSNYLSNNFSLIFDKENIQSMLPSSAKGENQCRESNNLNIYSFEITHQHSFNSVESSSKGVGMRKCNKGDKFNTINAFKHEDREKFKTLIHEVAIGAVTDRTAPTKKTLNSKKINKSGSKSSHSLKSSPKKISPLTTKSVKNNKGKVKSREMSSKKNNDDVFKNPAVSKFNYETNSRQIEINSNQEYVTNENDNVQNISINSNSTNINKAPEYKKLSKLSLGKYVHVFGDVVRNNTGNNSYSVQNSNRHVKSEIDGDITYLKKIPTSNTGNNSFITNPNGNNSHNNSRDHSLNNSILKDIKD